ncbi:MAG: hypothetical protein ACE1ZA_15260, partial [Pseudomonadales bacterium]
MWLLNSTLLQQAFRHANPVRGGASCPSKLPIWAMFLCGTVATLLWTNSALAAPASPLENLKGPDVTIIVGEARTVYEF